MSSSILAHIQRIMACAVIAVGLAACELTLPDEIRGPRVLATATDASIPSLVPIGTTRDRVVEILGAPQSTAQQSGGTSTSGYTYVHTSYARRSKEVRILTVQFDPSGRVSRTDFSSSSGRF